MKYVFIDNPISGNKNKQILFKQVQSAFRMIDDEMIIEETQKKGHATEIAADYAAKYGKDCVIVVVGGDGTVHEAVNGLAHTDSALMILPYGTGNDFAKRIYGTKKINADNVVKSFGLHSGKIKYNVRPIDLIDYNGEKCVNIMSFGLDVKVETVGRKIAGKVKFLGQQAYNIAIVPAVLSSMDYQINCELNCIDEDGKPYVLKETPLHYALFAVCNASYYGGGYCPAPNSILDDGVLDYCYVDPLTIPKALPIIPKYSEGTAAEQFDEIHTGQVLSGKFWMPDGSQLLGECDGENFLVDELNFKVEKQALNLCFID